MPLSALKYFHDYLLDLVFPKYCLSCRKEKQWLCPDCLVKIRVNDILVCPICKQENGSGAVCGSCRNKSQLDGLWVLSDYNDRLVQDLIKAIKYDYVCELAGDLGKIAGRYFMGLQPILAGRFLLPVPLHRRRYLERGFNQSEIIARSLGEALGLPLARRLLVRSKYLKAQAKLSREERLANIKEAFIYNKKISAVDKRAGIILVDDVYTTGATMQECAKVLKNEGFKSVWGVAVARGN